MRARHFIHFTLVGLGAATVFACKAMMPSQLQPAVFQKKVDIENCKSAGKKVVLDLDHLKTIDQDGLGICGHATMMTALGHQMRDVIQENLSPLCIALAMKPLEGKTRMGDNAPLWFEGVTNFCESFEAVKAAGGVPPASKVVFDQMPGWQAARVINLLAEYRIANRGMSPAERKKFESRLQELMDEARAECEAKHALPPGTYDSTHEMVKNQCPDLIGTKLKKLNAEYKEDCAHCIQHEDVLDHLEPANQKTLLEVVEKVNRMTQTDRDFLREAMGCTKNRIPIPKNLKCDNVFRYKNYENTGKSVWVATEVKGIRMSDSKRPEERIIETERDDDRGSANFAFASKYIRESLDKGRPLGLSIYGASLNPVPVPTPGASSTPPPPPKKVDRDGIDVAVTAMGADSDHVVSIIGYRVVKTGPNSCQVDYRIRNSWGANCDYLKDELKKNCDPVTGDFWIPQSDVQKISSRIGSLYEDDKDEDPKVRWFRLMQQGDDGR